jgi:hypothetical protein
MPPVSDRRLLHLPRSRIGPDGRQGADGVECTIITVNSVVAVDDKGSRRGAVLYTAQQEADIVERLPRSLAGRKPSEACQDTIATAVSCPAGTLPTAGWPEVRRFLPLRDPGMPARSSASAACTTTAKASGKTKALGRLWPSICARIDGVENLRLAVDRRARHKLRAVGRRRHVRRNSPCQT